MSTVEQPVRRQAVVVTPKPARESKSILRRVVVLFIVIAIVGTGLAIAGIEQRRDDAGKFAIGNGQRAEYQHGRLRSGEPTREHRARGRNRDAALWSSHAFPIRPGRNNPE